jgi:uncharacterized protein YciW
MANFDNLTQTKLMSVQDATAFLNKVRALYIHAKEMQAVLAKYQANTDTTFNAAINTLFTASERTELAAMLTQVNALVNDWDVNHAWVKT